MRETSGLPFDRSAHRFGPAENRAGLADLEAGGCRHRLAGTSASITRSLQGLQDALVLLVAALPADDPMVPRLNAAAQNMTRLARAVLTYGAVLDPHAVPEL
ncbi:MULTISPECIES: hypothetical protein [unclassified Methylobacterium]|uniref:hypothetical protein n=1 Tax=unclassified Methylobacterium TaxID=2615210 RepID=UPI0006F892E1|nr:MULTISPECIES: hypothetical protein [unclassified Methylobacterium]KQO64154.1 hypothetical protein ASF20_22070 [Methylobacterium sp. Leaf88]KQT81951.1 hypothetical protein ASG51_19525 [Methylobacterium sp. Leaf465]